MKKINLLLVILILSLTACTQNTRTTNWGSDMTINLPLNRKLINVTWDHNNDLWCVTRPIHPSEQPEVITMNEKSSFGFMQGTVTIIESKN